MTLRVHRRQEQKWLRLSLGVGSALTIWAIVVGIVGDSKSIIFDALFSLVGISLSGVSLFITQFVRKPDDDRLPFGRAQFEPFTITVESFIVIFLCVYSMATSVIDILNGGKSVELDVALPYLITSIVVCLGIWLLFRRKAREIRSEYLRVEATEWQLDALLSLGVLAALSLSYVLAGTAHAWLIPYLDPGTVVVISLFFIRIPLMTFRKNIRELLQFAPDDDIENAIHDAAEALAAEKGYEDHIVRVIKTGRSYTVEIDFLLPLSAGETSLVELDGVRQELYERIKGEYSMWLTISFTTERKWMI